VRQLEVTFGLERLGVEFLGKAGNVPVDDDFYQKVRTAFDKKKETHHIQRTATIVRVHVAAPLPRRGDINEVQAQGNT
jgi:hypothetical protein